MDKLYKIIIKTLITTVLSILLLIIIKVNPNYKEKIHYQIYENNISFASINKSYQAYFGSPIPFSDLFIKEKPVFNEKLDYKEKSKYKEGVKLLVSNEYLIPNQMDGIVLFIGEKKDYGKTIIIGGSDGIDRWYGNITNESIKLYDYVEKGSSIGTCNNELYLIFKKEGKVLDYNEYI